MRAERRAYTWIAWGRKRQRYRTSGLLLTKVSKPRIPLLTPSLSSPSTSPVSASYPFHPSLHSLKNSPANPHKNSKYSASSLPKLLLRGYPSKVSAIAHTFYPPADNSPAELPSPYPNLSYPAKPDRPPSSHSKFPHIYPPCHSPRGNTSPASAPLES